MNLSKLLPLMALVSMQALGEEQNQGEFYAKLNVDAQSSDKGDGRFSEIKSNNSWIGVKGDYQIVDGISVVYRLEWKVDITAESGNDSLTERPQYVGIRGGFGELTLGRNFTALWMAQGKIDLYNHYEGDIAKIWKGENRLSDVASYSSPSYQGFNIKVTYQAEKSAQGDSATSAGVFYGDENLKKYPLFAAIAHDFDVNGFDTTRASVQYKIGQHVIGGMLQQQEPADGGESQMGGLVSYSFNSGNVIYKVQYQTLEDDTNLNLGLDYPLGNNTKVFAWYSQIEKENNPDNKFLALGFEHKLSYKF
ncbi:porin [Paraglaciecola hydrolytica]|uniref:Porin domain-containing protein n=1 Tax=Paraglaciecola hydrolytica TaxID=1799789 RepID=A0A136A1R5_9ALTE|nr:porin [Paraglaciecola hydrolytica]KXI29176.1 hypothetical protein AX660_13580 [Paraglaciecola hydrolytica]